MYRAIPIRPSTVTDNLILNISDLPMVKCPRPISLTVRVNDNNLSMVSYEEDPGVNARGPRHSEVECLLILLIHIIDEVNSLTLRSVTRVEK